MLSLNINRTKLNRNITNRDRKKKCIFGQCRWGARHPSRDSIACYWVHRDYVCSSYCTCRWRFTCMEAFSDLGFSKLVFLHLILILGQWSGNEIPKVLVCILLWLISSEKRDENERKSHIYKAWHDFFFFF